MLKQITNFLRIFRLHKKKQKAPCGHNVPKEIHSTRLGVKYEVIIKRYSDKRGKKNAHLKSIMELTMETFAKGIPTTRLFYKEYQNLKFDIVRSPQQIKRWNRLKNLVITKEQISHRSSPSAFLIKENVVNSPPFIVFKKLCHSVERDLRLLV